jgi:cell fate regulator YaaT (PSP1 superfamily)
MLASSACEYLVSHGKNGGFGRFASAMPLECARGQRVVVYSRRGLEMGSVLCRTTSRHEHMLGSTPVCDLLRAASAADEAAAARMESLGQTLFEEARRLAGDLGLALEVVDIEVMLDGKQAIVQHLSPEVINATPLVEELARRHHIEILLENLANMPSAKEENHGCGKPDCGRGNGASCSDCGSGGGCSSCGAGKVDMRAYFAHLRTKMESNPRTALL